MVSTTILLNSGVYRLFGTPFGIKITPPVKHYIILSNKWGAVHTERGMIDMSDFELLSLVVMTANLIVQILIYIKKK